MWGRFACGVAVCGLLLGNTAEAQDVRGSISGRITDSSGGVVVGASVTVEHVGQGISRTVVTNEAGLFHALFLDPGEYRLTVQLSGFRTAVRDRIELRVEDRLKLDVQLEAAGVKEEIEVVAARPVLETGTATSGVVVDSTAIAELPLADGTAYFLARMAPGVEFTGDPKFTRPMDNVNLAGVTASGVVREAAVGENNAASSTEFSIDGAPNMISQNRLGFSPPSSAVQEFKVSTAVFDAGFGQGVGGSVNLAIKSGGNELKGELSYFNRDETRSANTLFAERLGMPKEARDYHRVTGTLRGPIRKGKTFFLISGEYLFDDAPEPLLTSVPTERQRRGDFSELMAVRIFDPATSRRVPDGRGGTRVERDAFPGNVIPDNRIHPVARNLVGYFPLPNIPRDQWRADLTQNYFTDRNRPYDYRGGLARIDHVLNDKNRLFLNLFRNWREEDRSNWSGTELSQVLTYRTNTGGILGWTWSKSSKTLVDVRLNLHHFGDWGVPGTDLRAEDLGFGPAAVALTRGHENMPRFDMETYSDFGRGTSDVPFFTAGLVPSLTRIHARHTLRAGYEFRLLRETNDSPGDRAGLFSFRGGATNQGTGATGANTHRDLATLLLGVPTGGDFDTNTTRTNQVAYQGLFVQDDWRVTSRLTLNLGLRWEMDFGTTESQNRNTRGFDFTTPNPVEGAARARFGADFAANPATFEVAPGRYLVTPDAFHVTGGYLYADAQHRDFWNTSGFNFLPRVGFTYQLTDKLVLRTGTGLYRIPYRLSGIDPRGYSRSTGIVANDSNNLPRLDIFDNPIPTGLLPPVGSSLGLLTDVGREIGIDTDDDTIIPYQRDSPNIWRFQVGFQYQLPGGVLLETNYVASRGYDLITRKPMNFLPADYLINSRVRDQAAEDFLTGDVPNPFRGLEPFRNTNHFNNTIDREKLLRAYPQFETFYLQEYNGSNRYDSLQLRLERRFASGFMVSANYTYGQLLEKRTRLNASDAELVERISTGERPHSVKLASIVELPYGKGRRWGADASRFVQAVLGGWRLSVNFLWQAGSPISWGNLYYDPSRDPSDLKTRYGKDEQGRRYGIDIPAWDITGFYFSDLPTRAAQLADNRIRINSARYKRSFPQTIDGMRNPPYHNLDIGLAKTFDIGRGMKLQVRAEALNAENYAELSGLETDPTDGSFGFFDSQRTLPRDIQLGLRLTF
jgi:hypothetical protein